MAESKRKPKSTFAGVGSSPTGSTMSTLKSADEFFSSPQPSTMLQEAKETTSESLVDEDQLRTSRDWSYLADQIVGAEV